MTPKKIARKEINLAEAIATFIPALLLPVKYHIKDFNITPPSRGSTGIKLIKTTKRLIPPISFNKLENITNDPDKKFPNIIINAPTKMLTIGPDNAIFKLPFEVEHSFSRFANPPIKESVIL